MQAASKLMDDPGWPLNIMLTPDGRPFFAAAYIPTERLRAILERMGKAWKEHPEQIAAAAEMVMQSLTPQPIAADAPLGSESLTKAYQELAARFDAANGGLLPAPKVPAGHQLMFLLRYWRRSGDARALEMVETTLRAMRRGAIYDHCRVRLSSLCGRCGMAEAAHRDAALRPGHSHDGVSGGISGHRQERVRADGAPDFHVRPSRSPLAGGSVLQRAGCQRATRRSSPTGTA